MNPSSNLILPFHWDIFSGRLPGKINSTGQDATSVFDNKTEMGTNPCQDFVFTFVKRNEKVIGVVMADGAGSARFPQEGAYTVTRGIVDRIFRARVSGLDDIFNYSEEDIRNLFYYNAINLLNEKIKALSDDPINTQPINLSDLSTTLMCFLSDGERYIALSIGDGVIGECSEDHHSEIILSPEQFMYTNLTYYITDPDAKQHLRIKKGVYNPKSAYILMTDGTSESTYDKKRRIFAPIIHKFSDIVRQYDRKTTYQIIMEKMANTILKKTIDDCALAIITCRRM